jgi:D-glycero-D-manno-heptose 1,7-bisphosphate phosphatase
MLYIFDMDGTVIESYMDRRDKDYHAVKPLPGVVEKLAALQAAGHQVAIASNQGGIAFGYNSEEDWRRKLGRAMVQLGLPADTPVAVCFSDARSKHPRYNKPDEVARRKPSGAMLRELMAQADATADQTMYIGDRPEDQAAAADAGVAFTWADDFFATIP